ncbi:hypothetical protein [Rhodoblastus sp.]|uniref:hypothetical protein n=1 Tax=Rhodoblastus sp. TaxID=1962975 RepID=UPI00261A85D7|nr:hypothetical protein [Rhodoblastus sp.]
MTDHDRLLREAAASDAAGVLARAADDIERVAAHLDDISQVTLGRVVASLRTIARLKRPKVPPKPAPTPGDVRDF